jgi:protease-4
LTGSIGVGATIPTFQRTLEQVGVNFDGIGTTQLDGQYDLLMGLGPDVKALVAQTVSSTYEQFVNKVAMHRGRAVDEIEVVARGRVWTGAAAQERGLVDALGDLDDAVASAAELAGLEEGRYHVDFVEPQLGFAERLALELVQAGAPVIASFATVLQWPQPLTLLLESAQEPLRFLTALNDPRGLYAYCFCDVK